MILYISTDINNRGNHKNKFKKIVSSTCSTRLNECAYFNSVTYKILRLPQVRSIERDKWLNGSTLL